MQKNSVQRPTYVLESVDNALRLLQILRDVGAVRLKDVAAELDIAPSTAHRLLSMLVYRGFAVQGASRLYLPGPAMGVVPTQGGWARELTDRCRPHMEALSMLCGETVNLVIRIGTQVRFLLSAESHDVVRVGDRQGQILDAEITAGGRILLAELHRETLEQLYLRTANSADNEKEWGHRRLGDEDFERFLTGLAAVRAVGFAVNVQQTEDGVAVFGVAIRNKSGVALGALTVSVPIVRYHRHIHGPLLAQLKYAVGGLAMDVAHIKP